MGGPAPEWIQVFPYPVYVGELDGERVEWITDEISQQSCVDFFELRGNDLVIDYEHLSDKDTEAPAAGRIVELRAGGRDGLLARVEWTERARTQLQDGEYYYDSPSFFWSRKDRRIYGLRHVALTNNPASWGRPYITDHTARHYGIGRTAQARAGETLELTCAIANNKGGRELVTNSSILESFRTTLRRSSAVTGKELRADLAKIIEEIPDTDDAVFGAADANVAVNSATTLGHVVADEQIGEAVTAASEKSGATAVHSEQKSGSHADLTPIAVALGLESADPRELALAVMHLKASTVPAEELRQLEERLSAAEAKSGEERIALDIARQRSAGKQITPAFEAELLRVAKSDYELALSSLSGLQVTSIDLATQSDAPAPMVLRLEEARQRAEVITRDLPATASDALKQSASAHEQTLAIASEKGITYLEANQLRLDALRKAA